MRDHGDNVDTQHYVDINIDKHFYLNTDHYNLHVNLYDVIDLDINKHIDVDVDVNIDTDEHQYHYNKHIIDNPNHDLNTHDDNVVTDKHVNVDINSDDDSIYVCVQPLHERRNVC